MCTYINNYYTYTHVVEFIQLYLKKKRRHTEEEEETTSVASSAAQAGQSVQTDDIASS